MINKKLELILLLALYINHLLIFSHVLLQERYNNLSFFPFPCINNVFSEIFRSSILISVSYPILIPVDINKSIIAKFLVASNNLKELLQVNKSFSTAFIKSLILLMDNVFGNFFSFWNFIFRLIIGLFPKYFFRRDIQIIFLMICIFL